MAIRKPTLRVTAIHTSADGRFFLTLKTGRVIAIERAKNHSRVAYVPTLPDDKTIHTLHTYEIKHFKGYDAWMAF